MKGTRCDVRDDGGREPCTKRGNRTYNEFEVEYTDGVSPEGTVGTEDKRDRQEEYWGKEVPRTLSDAKDN